MLVKKQAGAKKSPSFMQPITRVHNIFRIRTIVNAVTRLNLEGKRPGDDEIGLILASTGLSKFRRQKAKDRIMRRARDHLLTASYMGFLSRIGRPFEYSSTSSGQELRKYGPTAECPNDEREEAAFIDRILRFKLTNVYDLQLGRQYVDLRSRPCLYLLHILRTKSWLHEHQLAFVLGGIRCDPSLEDESAKKTVLPILKYNGSDQADLERLYSTAKADLRDRKNMTRNIRPLLDWCESLSLVESKQVEGTTGRIYALTPIGERVLELYSRKAPVWYDDLGATPAARAAILLLYQYAKQNSLRINGKFLSQQLRIGLTEEPVINILKSLSELGVGFSEDYSTLIKDIDFQFEYDVPPEARYDVLAHLATISQHFRLKPKDIIRSLQSKPIVELQSLLQEESKKVSTSFIAKFSKSTAISEDPVLAKVQQVMPSVGILNQYRSEFEKEVALLLRMMNINAIKYQGQLADRCSKSHVMRFFENNPDILVINGIESLFECKSIGEWHSPLTGEKGVQKEFVVYQQYIAQIKSDSVVIVYEGLLDGESTKLLSGLLSDSSSIVFVTKNFLLNCIYKPHLRGKLLAIIKEPRKFKPEERILAA